MIELEDIIYNRKKEIVNTYNLIVSLEQMPNVTIHQSASLKASIFIMLYNLLEGLITQSFTLLFDEIATNVNHIDNLNDSMQKLYYRIYQNKLSSAKEIQKFVVDYPNVHKITYDEYKQKVELYSGNLDARKVRDLLQSIGNQYELHTKNEDVLVDIKSARNKLAHGEFSYAEIGRNYTVTEIKRKYILNMFRYVDAFERQIESYISQKKYLR